MNLIYISNADGDGSPCIKVYRGKSISWWRCEDETSLYSSLLRLLQTSSKRFVLMNVYGNVTEIPNDPRFFAVETKADYLKGIVYNPVPIEEIASKGNVKKVTYRRKVVNIWGKAMNVEEFLGLGIRIIEPFKLPSL
ncbi:hypothetical protein [Sulfuracidifex metallicus]|uniref:hypothetical protein n=2 Tax=Sulfuracidifex metallicus TaxID=47303 RepID=UPI00138FF0DC|nr:hypothetical protein [Sulfuracidifex metallicus]WOE50399.1 hypothetical protein RQ359_001924 [Sulfuracidifex metallicus DSM 6482 = JCM 9184]